VSDLLGFICWFIERGRQSKLMYGKKKKIAIIHRNCKNLNQNPILHTYGRRVQKGVPSHARRIVPKEIKVHEYSGGPHQGGAGVCRARPHSVIVETNAGAGIGATDGPTEKAGARFADTAGRDFRGRRP